MSASDISTVTYNVIKLVKPNYSIYHGIHTFSRKPIVTL